MRNVIGYAMGEPEIGGIHVGVFRDEKAIRYFILGLPEKNMVDLYKVTGRVIEDDGTPDGLQMLVLNYEPFRFVEN